MYVRMNATRRFLRMMDAYGPHAHMQMHIYVYLNAHACARAHVCAYKLTKACVRRCIRRRVSTRICMHMLHICAMYARVYLRGLYLRYANACARVCVTVRARLYANVHAWL